MPFALFLICSFMLLGRPQDILVFLQSVRPALVFTILAMLALVLGQRRPMLGEALATPEAKRMLILFALMVIGIPFAHHRGLAFSGVFQSFLVNVFFFLLVLSHVRTLRELKLFVWTICLCTATYAVFGGLMQGGSGGRFQSTGGFLDPNDTAFVLLALFPISLFFIQFREGSFKKLVAAVSVLSAVAVILLTGSRGGILGFGVVVALMLLTGLGRFRFGQKALFVIMLVLTFFLMQDKIDVERYMSLADVSSDYNVSSDGGRLELWGSAIDLAMTHPLTGVGVECFPFAHFESRQRAGEEFLRWQYAHNSFLQVASEVGLIGLFIFVLMVARSLGTFLRISREKGAAASADLVQLRALAGFMVIGFAGLLVSGFFLSQAYSMFFTLYFALGAVMTRLHASLASAAPQDAPQQPEPEQDHDIPEPGPLDVSPFHPGR